VTGKYARLQAAIAAAPNQSLRFPNLEGSVRQVRMNSTTVETHTTRVAASPTRLSAWNSGTPDRWSFLSASGNKRELGGY